MIGSKLAHAPPAPPPRLSDLPELPCAIIVDFLSTPRRDGTATAALAALSLASRAWGERVGWSDAWRRVLQRRDPAHHGYRQREYNRRDAAGQFGAAVEWRAVVRDRYRRSLAVADAGRAPLPPREAPSVLARVRALFAPAPDARDVVLTGIDAAGKTTILRQLLRREPELTIPTIGFNVEQGEICHGRVNLISWGVGGSDKLGALLRHYYRTTAAVVFVVDCADDDAGWSRVDFAGKELGRILREGQLAGVPLLVLASKQDRLRAIGPAALAARLGLPAMTERPWAVAGCVGPTAQGLAAAVDWLTASLGLPRHGA
jgi:signal recognition particle receptor subunit beta